MTAYSKIAKLPAGLFSNATRSIQDPNDANWSRLQLDSAEPLGGYIDSNDWYAPDTQALSDYLQNAGGYNSKYNAVTQIDPQTMRLTVQQPGGHKYDTAEAIYRQGSDGSWDLANDPSQSGSRQTGALRDFGNFAYDGLTQFVLPAAAMYFGGQALGGLAAGAGAGASAATTAGTMTAEQVAMLAANGLTDAQIAAMATAAGDTAMASSLTGAGMGGAGVGAAAAEPGIKTLGNIAPSAATEAVAPLATTGLESAAPLITSGVPQVGGGLLSGGLEKIGTGLLDYAKQNPKAVGGLLGAITGGAGGPSSGSSEAPYTGPMPTISRGGWQPRAQATQMALPQFGQGLKTTPGAANSGLWRFMGQ